MKSPLRTAAEHLSSQLTDWRRHLHAHPELSGQEQHTAAFVADELRRLGYTPQERIADALGLTATIGDAQGPAIALRADMDALPITEENTVPYASQDSGVMHACGHDAHVAMLLGAAKLLADRHSELEHPIKLIFQPAEEFWPGGAAPLIQAGVLDDVACILGLHIWADMPLGTLGTRVGPFMAGVTDLHITITGQGGHAAMPQQCVDPVIVAAHVITALQTVVSRSLAMSDSAVVSVTRLQAGTTTNIIPPSVELWGTIRALSQPMSATVCRQVRKLATDIAQAFDAHAEVDLTPGYPPLVNDHAVVDQALAAARAVGFRDEELLTLPPQGGGEDFAYYAREVPAAFVFLGARNEAKGCTYPHHHPRFNIDEEALPLGAAVLTQFALSATPPNVPRDTTH